MTTWKKKPVIVVLDDMKHRVDWLRGAVGAEAEVLWATTVKGFLKILKGAQRRGGLCLVLLDHDLDFNNGRTDNCDVDGLCGTDVAKTMTLDDMSVPVVIWSLNGPCAMNMEDILLGRGFKISRMMYHFRNILKSMISQIVADASIAKSVENPDKED